MRRLSDSILDLRFDEFHDRYVPLIKARDYAAAEALCRSYIAVADQAGDAEAGAMFASFLCTPLSIAGRHAEALEALDLRLVTTMAERGLARTECVAYLEVAEAIGATSNEPRDAEPLKRVRELLTRVQAGA